MTARLARRVVEFLLSRIRSGTLVVVEDGEPRRYGSGAPTAIVTVSSPRVWWALLRGSVGMADAYAAGWWGSPDLAAVIRLAARNAAATDLWRARLAPARRPLRAVRGIARASTCSRRRRDIAAHYDLGDQLFARMLDPTMTYSCAVFDREEMTLEQAQLAKLELVCEKLALAPGDRVLEIGTGWGSLALHAAATRGCHVTTTTISQNQHARAVEQVQRAGLSDRVTVLCEDYRDLCGRYDKLVSIEMIEAVGWRHTGTFLAACSERLEPHGAALLQAITIDDRLYEIEKASRTFIKQRIFPGGSLPSVESITRDLAHHTDLQLVDLHDLTPHYVMTLRCWRQRFANHAEELASLGYDERFRRLWTLYLAYCEAGFAERRIADVQLLLAKPRYRLPVAGGVRNPNHLMARTAIRQRAVPSGITLQEEQIA